MPWWDCGRDFLNLIFNCVSCYVYLPAHFWLKICFTEVELIYNVVLVSSVQQSDSVSYIYVYVYTYTYTFFSESSLGREIKLGVLD